MGRCFVIQPFDNGAYDKRYDDVLAPAIKAADLEPYRVDRDAGVTIPIDTIEAEIRTAEACVADITEDNPNVWYELGYAFAQGKDVVMVCAKGRRTKPPFDVQHRNILFYESESSRDFTKLATEVTKRLQAGHARRKQLLAMTLSQPVEETGGLTSHEIAVLVVLMENRAYPTLHTTGWGIIDQLVAMEYRKVAATLAIESLVRKGMVELDRYLDPEDREVVSGYLITASGIDWLMSNQHQLVLRSEKEQAVSDKPNPG